MNELLEKVSHDLGFAVQGLREALTKASAVESLIIIKLIGQAREVQVNVDKFMNARALDSKESEGRYE